MMTDKLIKTEIEEGDILDFFLTNGMAFRAIVEMKMWDYCKILLTQFNDPNEKKAIGQLVSIYYNENIRYNGNLVKEIKKIPNHFKLYDEDYHALQHLAVNTNDKQWFRESGIIRKYRMGVQCEK